MVPLTVCKESALTEAVSSALTGNLGILSLCPRFYAFFAYTASAEVMRLHSKQRMVIVSAEFSGEQGHEIGSVLLGSRTNYFFKQIRVIPLSLFHRLERFPQSPSCNCPEVARREIEEKIPAPNEAGLSEGGRYFPSAVEVGWESRPTNQLNMQKKRPIPVWRN